MLVRQLEIVESEIGASLKPGNSSGIEINPDLDGVKGMGEDNGCEEVDGSTNQSFGIV